MFTCPEDDIHSVYLDGELPEEFVAEYEAHVASCPKCSAKLEKLTQIKGFLHEDSEAIKFTQKQLDDSFLRLQTKMKYNNFKKENRRANVFSFRNFKGVQYFAAGAAAAAVIAFAIPRGSSSAAVAAQKEFSPVARSASTTEVNPVLMDSDFDAVQLASFLGSDDADSSLKKTTSAITAPVSSAVAGSVDDSSVAVQKMILDDSGAYKNTVVQPALADYDVFTPVDTSQQKKQETDHSKGFTFSVSSPFLKVSFQVGK